MYIPNWGAEVITGNQQIDTEHRELFLKIDNLMVAMSHNREGEVALETLEFFARYAKEHFKAEERLHQQCQAPDYEAHAAAHARISREIDALRQLYQEEGLTPAIEFRLVNQVIRSIVDQMHAYDLPLARFIQQSSHELSE